MDIRQIEYFNAVVDTGSFTAAAAGLHVSQPAVTAAIRMLEEELDVKLFLRDRRTPVLTAEGRLFRDRTLPLLSGFESIRSEMKKLSETAEARLNIGVIPVAGAGITTLLHTGFHRQYPQYILNVPELGSHGCMTALEEDSIDLAFMVLTDECRVRYNTIPVHKGVVNAVMSRHHRFATRKSISVNDLDGEPVILLPEHAYVSRKVSAAFTQAGVQPNIIATPSQMFTVFNLVSHEAGISFVLGDGFAFGLDSPSIAAVPLEPFIHYELGFVWKKDIRLNTAARDCIKYFRELYDIVK